MKNILSLISLFIISTSVMAQNIAVKSFDLRSTDIDARVNFPKRDQNGELCAIIKVETNQKDFIWEPDALGIVAAEYKTGEYWLYVPRGAKRLTIKHPLLGVLRDYAYPIPIQEANVYLMVLVTGTVETTVKEAEVLTQWLAVNSTPEGASVFVEEQLVGTTPFTRKYPEGDYSYRVELPRYHSEAGKVALKGERKTLTFALRPKFGNLSVTSAPENGMIIYLDDENTGKVTPATLNEVSSGTHTLKLISQWYQPQARSVTVSDNQTTKADFTMQPAFADITIKTEPSADILIDGTRKGNGTYTSRMLAGIYTVKSEREKHHPDQKQLTVTAGTPQTITLNPKPQTGTLDVTSTPFDAAITVDGRNYGTTPNTVNNLLIGNYSVTLTKAGFGTITKTVTITEGKTTEVNETLPTGMEVTIASTPSGAQLWVGGVSVGTTPYKANLAFGSHSVKLVNGKKEVNETITVTQGGKTRWEFDVNEFPPSGTFTDSRDGKKYKYVTIGKQVWMAENLAYKPNSVSYWAYDNNTSNVNKYGYLYDWQTAKNVCPTGWHLPSDTEWTQLTDFVGSNPGTKLKAKNGWSSNGNGTDDYGFSALPGGSRYDGGRFYYVGYAGTWWSSTENGTNDAWGRRMTSNYSNVYRYNYDKSWGFSVRCVRDF